MNAIEITGLRRRFSSRSSSVFFGATKLPLPGSVYMKPSASSSS